MLPFRIRLGSFFYLEFSEFLNCWVIICSERTQRITAKEKEEKDAIPFRQNAYKEPTTSFLGLYPDRIYRIESIDQYPNLEGNASFIKSKTASKICSAEGFEK
jgi:hypothetical protein